MIRQLNIIGALALIFATQNVWAQNHSDVLFFADSGSIVFLSNAPLEDIQAQSNDLQGVIDMVNNTFAFTVEIKSFQGFNSELQRTHFNENYLESDRHKEAKFTGKIIEKIDFSIPGDFTIRAKGNLDIHGVKQERIIKVKIQSDGEKLIANAYFTVLLAEHDISVPKVVYQKISQEIQVFIDVQLSRR